MLTRVPSNNHDVILWYGKGDEWVYNRQFTEYEQSYIASHYNSVEEGTSRRYTLSDTLNPNKNRPNLTYEWHGQTRVWRWTREKMQQLHDEGRLVYTSSGMPRYKRYLDEMPGVPITDVWTDINPINSQANESLGYPTQKPVALLERIVNMASNPGDVVLDPFCGCGTAIDAAQGLGREWIGIDVTHLAVNLIKTRLKDRYPDCAFRVVGEPEDEAGARELAGQDRFQFEYWALALVGARPASGERKKGADTGVDGVLYVVDNPREKAKKIVVQVKSGKVGVAQVRDFAHVVDREEAIMGLFLTLDAPTQPMLTEAASAGVYERGLVKDDQVTYPRLQILTIADLLAGKQPQVPTVQVTYKAAGKAREGGQQLDLFADNGEDADDE